MERYRLPMRERTGGRGLEGWCNGLGVSTGAPRGRARRGRAPCLRKILEPRILPWVSAPPEARQRARFRVSGGIRVVPAPRCAKPHPPRRAGTGMPATVIIGGQWGDEGKGRIVD